MRYRKEASIEASFLFPAAGFRQQFLCGELGYHVQELKRTRIMNIRLGHLKTGTWRNVTEEELQELLYLLEESEAEAAETAETEGAE